MKYSRTLVILAIGLAVAVVASSFDFAFSRNRRADRSSRMERALRQNAVEVLQEGRRIFRHDTLGDEVFWGDTLKLHTAIAGAAHGGVGDGLSPAQALALGLKVDVDALPGKVRGQIRREDI